MVIIIDAYNVLKQQFASNDISEFQRNQFIKQCIQYSKKKGHKLVVVFDSGPFTWPSRESKNGVQVIYSGQKKTADEFIKEYIEKNRIQNGLLISSDRELNRWALDYDVDSLDSHLFLPFLQEKEQIVKKSRKQSLTKTATTTNQTIDKLMEEVIINEINQKIENNGEQNLSNKTVSKKDRKLLQKIKKL